MSSGYKTYDIDKKAYHITNGNVRTLNRLIEEGLEKGSDHYALWVRRLSFSTTEIGGEAPSPYKSHDSTSNVSRGVQGTRDSVEREPKVEPKKQSLIERMTTNEEADAS